jgi:hypothetical protein
MLAKPVAPTLVPVDELPPEMLSVAFEAIAIFEKPSPLRVIVVGVGLVATSILVLGCQMPPGPMIMIEEFELLAADVVEAFVDWISVRLAISCGCCFICLACCSICFFSCSLCICICLS